MKSLGEFTTEVAIAVNEQDFGELKSLLATAYEDHETEEVRTCLQRALSPLSRDSKQWFEKTVILIQSGGEPDNKL